MRVKVCCGNVPFSTSLRGTAREALQFYREAFGGEVSLVTYADAHNVRDPLDADRIMWGQVAAEDGFRVMAYDVPGDTAWNPGENAYFVSVACDTAQQATARWQKLLDGASVIQPLAPSGWSALYGMLKDRFGVVWVMSIAAG